MKPTIAIVGASARAAAASAVRAGFQPITADLFADVDLRQIATATRISPYPDAFLDWMRAMEPPAWMYTGALENHPALVDQMAWIAPLWGNPGDVLERVRSPHELANALSTIGLLFPETCDSAEGLPQDGSWLTKTYHGASGSGVRVWGGEQGAGSREQETHLENDERRSVYYQRRMNGTPAAAVFVAMDDTAVLYGVTRQLIGEPWLRSLGFQYSGSVGPLQISEATNETLVKLGDVLTKHFGLSGLFGVDFILDGDDVWTVEVNPRYTASVEVCERIAGWHAISSHVSDWLPNAHTGDPAWTRLPKLTHGKAIVFAQRDLVISEKLAQFAMEGANRTPWPSVADVSPAGAPVEAGRPILTVFSEGADVQQVEQRLRERVAEIERLAYEGEL